MKVFSDLSNPQVASLIKDGAIGVIPTDTLYGIVASIYHKSAVERLYKLRMRNENKACIVIAANITQITDTDTWQPLHWQIAEKYWPGSVSIVLPTTEKTPSYLQRGVQTPPYRVPDFKELRKLLTITGPLVAPSANLQDQSPAKNLQQAHEYFGDLVDFYVDGGTLDGQPSTLINVHDGKVQVLRQGSVIINDFA